MKAVEDAVDNDVHGTIYNRLEKLIPDLRELEPGDARKSEVSGFMDLNLDVLSKNDKELRIALAHYFEQNGDLVPDPDMEIRVYLMDGWKKAEALTYQDQRRYNEVYPEPGKMVPALKKSLNDFLAQWLKNCIDQGHNLSGGE